MNILVNISAWKINTPIKKVFLLSNSIRIKTNANDEKIKSVFHAWVQKKAVGPVQDGKNVAAASKTLSVLGLALFNWVKAHLARATRRCVEQSGDCWANGDQWTQDRTGLYKNGADHSRKSNSAYDVRGLEINYVFAGLDVMPNISGQ